MLHHKSSTGEGSILCKHPNHHLHHAAMLSNISTWIHVQLLGPCFKTGWSASSDLQQVKWWENVDIVNCEQWTENPLLLFSIQTNPNVMASVTKRYSIGLQLFVPTRLTICCVRCCCHIQLAFPPVPQFSKFKYHQLPFQSCVSLFPHGTCLLSV